jgi:hypothetical protein
MVLRGCSIRNARVGINCLPFLCLVLVSWRDLTRNGEDSNQGVWMESRRNLLTAVAKLTLQLPLLRPYSQQLSESWDDDIHLGL